MCDEVIKAKGKVTDDYWKLGKNQDARRTSQVSVLFAVNLQLRTMLDIATVADDVMMMMIMMMTTMVMMIVTWVMMVMMMMILMILGKLQTWRSIASSHSGSNLKLMSGWGTQKSSCCPASGFR